ncbi:hypothetical protein BDZ91DRAFT_715716 [Kalaharituber pfeilii]|nr:hypothetical protein BDZ91DRAFT_715716 [Kalaharituber pfeilii]
MLVIWCFAMINPILSCFERKVGRDIRLRREKEIVSVDSEAGRKEEFVVIDVVSVTERNFVLVIEGKKSSLREAMKQCLLSMKDIRDNNGYGGVYGFITRGEFWKCSNMMPNLLGRHAGLMCYLKIWKTIRSCG